MKLAIACHPTHGGSGVVASELGMRMARRGHEVHFVSYQLPFRVDQRIPGVHFHEVEVTSYPLFRYPPYALALATKLVSVVRNHGVQLLHVHYALPHAISAVLTKQMCSDCGIRTVTTLHGTDITIVGSDHSFAEITRFGILGSDGITAVSEHLAAATRQDFDIRRDIDVIPNFVDTREYSPARRDPDLRRRFARDDEVLIAHVSNFRPVKRVQDVAEVFAGIAAKRPARLLMVGTGPDVGAAEDLLEARGVRDRVTFEGTVAGVADLLAAADLFLLPSDSESFGLAALEAMASGVPVVGAAAGGLPEVVAHGETGFLCPVGDTAGMTEASLNILEDGAADYGGAARARAETCFEMDRVVDRYEDVYRRVLAQRPITWTQSGP